jgi:signal transduction histidine kinase
VSWQYNFRAVVAFSVGTALLEIMVGYPLDRLGGPKLGDVAGALILRSILFVLIGFMVVRLMAAQRIQRKALAEANSQLTRYAVALEQLVVSRERNRMARELHDTLAHTLSALAVQLEAMSALWDTDSVKARALLGESLGSTRSGLSEARRAIQALRSTPLEDVGLALAVRDLAESVAARSALKLTLDIPEQITTLTPDAEQAIYRIADEAMTNVARHAQAQRLSVMLRHSGGSGLRLEIADDGRGFDPAQSPATGHYGLQGIQERADLIGAQVQVDSRPGQGTTFRLTLEGTA